MEKQYAFALMAVIMAILIPLVPKMVRLRIAVLQKLHLNRIASWHERYADGIVFWVRLLLGALAVILVLLAFGAEL